MVTVILGLVPLVWGELSVAGNEPFAEPHNPLWTRLAYGVLVHRTYSIEVGGMSAKEYRR